jgi:undecaprenyl-phosphate galactose phosphotransferase
MNLTKKIQLTKEAKIFICILSVIAADIFILLSFYGFFRINQHYSYFRILNSEYIYNENYDLFVILAFLFIASSFFSGHYSKRRIFWDDARSILISLSILALLDISAQALSGKTSTLYVYLAQWVTLAVTISCGRLLAKNLLRKVGIWQIPTAILGSGDNAVQAFHTLNQEPILGYDVRCFIHISSTHSIAPDLPPSVPLVHLSLDFISPEEIVIDSEKSPFLNNHIVIASDEMNDTAAFRIMDILSAHGSQIDIAPPLRGLPLLEMEISHVFGREAIILHTKNSLARPVRRWLKRCVDFFIALTAFVLLLPLMAYLAYRIRGEDGGPAFFYQERIGFGGKTFECIKFRSMKVDAEDALARWKEESPSLWEEYQHSNFKIRNDPRITKIGEFIRITSLDELPQIINVLKGEMSIVGPRPILGREIDSYGQGYLHYCRVHPGITGIWQISGRSNTSFLDRAFYDEWYIKNWSLWYDFVIIIKTIPAILKRDGAY